MASMSEMDQLKAPYESGALRCVKNLFGEQQLTALADYIQAALMLNYNGRNVG